MPDLTNLRLVITMPCRCPVTAALRSTCRLRSTCTAPVGLRPTINSAAITMPSGLVNILLTLIFYLTSGLVNILLTFYNRFSSLDWNLRAAIHRRPWAVPRSREGRSFTPCRHQCFGRKSIQWAARWGWEERPEISRDKNCHTHFTPASS